METITFTCNICQGKIIFDEGDDPIINTCTCEDNPIKESEEAK